MDHYFEMLSTNIIYDGELLGALRLPKIRDTNKSWLTQADSQGCKNTPNQTPTSLSLAVPCSGVVSILQDLDLIESFGPVSCRPGYNLHLAPR